MKNDLPSSILHPRHILVRGTNWLGDAVMTTPALLRLREKFPDAHISLLTPEKLADLWKFNPTVDSTISIAPGEGVFAVAKKIRAGNFDLALVLPNSPRSALETFLAGVPKSIGYSRPWRNFFLTQTVAPRPDAVKMRKRSIAEINQLIAQAPEARGQISETGPQTPDSVHQVHDYLHLVAALGANPAPLPPRLVVDDVEVNDARQKFIGANPELIIGLNPGAEYGPAKRWPVDRFIAAAKQIQQKTRCTWLLFGGKNDIAIINRIESELRSPNSDLRNLAGKTSLRELMALLKSCRVLLTNDTGPMHVAAALGVPVVVPFGSTSPELTGPISSDAVRHQLLKANVPCAPCFLRECPIDFRCMNSISVDAVVKAVLESRL